MAESFVAPLLPLAALALTPTLAAALQVVEARDGVAVEAIVSQKEATRIRIEGAPIADVFGAIHTNHCAQAPAAGGTVPAAPVIHPGGELVLECDRDKGEVYVRPVGTSSKPINLFVSSAHATYTLLLRRSDVPADTIVIRDRTPRSARTTRGDGAPAPHGPAGQAAPHVRALKSMLLAMASDTAPAEVQVETLHVAHALWAEAEFTLVARYTARDWIGEKFRLTNISDATMVLAEQEFDRDDGQVVAVAIEQANLRPGDSTLVYLIRQGN